MIYGLEVLDTKGVQTLGMEDFTIQRLAMMTIPASRRYGSGSRRDYITMDVEGYDASTCFVSITPKAYSPYPQGMGQAYWGCVPTYVDLGGTKIGIITYSNAYETDFEGKWVYTWAEEMVESVIEVVRVI
ncbi:hypothetical protein [Pseudomonas weihenstephanensis]|uniref:Uncharacterized protein n=1 Tax=Pseudomonas weihenstephanensis TaxID=1608994 RepID=A0ABS1ZM38_9PSED|nr:hypothetical protein [Pseudomonas weihenstephanensis]KMN17734.1 hypothetical protein TU87_14315 [Pseudomonas weihenstephanensis]MBM1191516.1 hypothetical protein [Pseudomonas weihenstephanensis]MBM1197548.1 hypothetical protein [Pseudomonas weihenstephanensis]GLX92039.1 hypothetical protein Pfra02_46070 [Pseudomonas fragi]